MPTKFEEAIAAAKAAHYESPEILQLIDLIVAQNERIKNLELYSVEGKHRLGALETTAADHDHSIGSLAKSRDDHEARVKAVENRPAENNKRIDELDKRVTTVEGAVGSKAYKRNENKVEPVKTNGVVTEPAPDAPKHFWDAPAAPAAPVAP
jgi:chromosome segregation ATPase